MSYTVDIVDAAVPCDEEEAWVLLDRMRDLADEQGQGEPSPAMMDLYARLTGKYPCIMEDPDGPWSDGPLLGNFGEKITTLGISFSRVEEVLPFLIETATGMGFVVFDAQDEAIYGDRAPAATAGAAPTRVPRKWWQFWLP